MAWYESDAGVRLWYEERGEGPVIVLIHGWCKSSTVWRFQIDALSRQFRVIAPDLTGYGKSVNNADGHHLENYAADIVTMFKVLDLRKALLVGWSQGAQIALKASAFLKNRLSGLVLVSGTPRFICSNDFPYGLSETEAEGMANKVRRNLGRALAGFNAHMFAKNELDDCLDKQRILDLLSSEPVPETMIATQGLRALYQADLRPQIAGVDLPTLIINGDSDPICLPEASAYMAKNIAGSRQIVFSESGHAPFLTHAIEFNSCLSDFHRGNLGFVR